MARSMYSLSPSPGPALSPSFTDSSLDGSVSAFPEDESRPGSPSNGQHSQFTVEDLNGQGTDTVTCQWEECGVVFNHLPTFIEHIHNDHIGVHKSNYTCEWASCSRRGLPQTSRFALISHIRSHTGEKPFICTRPECDKSFTRSDALAKHMRLQHNISPPLPGRGGSRKRKRGDDPPAAADAPPHPNAAPDPAGFTTFKVEPHTPREPSPGPPGASLGAGGSHARGGHEDHGPRSPSPEDGGEDDGLPVHLAEVADPATGLIFGRSPAMVRYLVMKAKERYALREHYALIEELRTLRAQERAWREAKDVALDDVLRAEVGPPADHLIAPLSVVHQLGPYAPQSQPPLHHQYASQYAPQYSSQYRPHPQAHVQMPVQMPVQMQMQGYYPPPEGYR